MIEDLKLLIVINAEQSVIENLGYKMIECQQITSGFAKLGGGVITQTLAHPLTVGDNPDGVQLTPQLQSRRDVV